MLIPYPPSFGHQLLIWQITNVNSVTGGLVIVITVLDCLHSLGIEYE